MTKYDFSITEPKILKFWKDNKIWEKINKKNKGNKKFYFLDGPPYTSGKVHIGTAWNKSLKDSILRYKRMQGFDVWDRAGYDMHGMPTEMATMKELGIEDKHDIEKMGVAKFVKECEKLAIRNMKEMNNDFTKLGVWMDFKNAYQPISQDYIEGEWWLIKKAHENNRLYLGEKTMTWCPKCATALAKHELEYKKLTDNSIYLKFKLSGTKNEYLLVWTTTPWTIPFNLGVMVNPQVTYIKAEVEEQIWFISKDLADEVIKEKAGKDYTILQEFSGSELIGMKYTHPLYDDLNEVYDGLDNKSGKIHTVVASEEFVTTEAGTGLVHMAPGCGPEDYKVGHREGIAPFNELNENGVFSDKMGPFKGWTAKVDDDKFVEHFENKEALVHKERFTHDYAHCWRCKKPIVYRTTSQWFFKIEDLKENMREINRSIYWVPDHAGSKNYDSWLENLRDNGITRQRYWGTPLPVWKCDKCNEYTVISSVEELKQYTSKIPKDLHKPWIDEVKWDCKCGGKMLREPDILDVWIDAGSASWNCIYYPKREDLFEEMFPPDFILEGIDQIRGWFNLLFVASMVSMNKPSFKAVYMHGFVQDAHGRKMSKSLGNYILPEEVISKYGSDTLRHYIIGGTNPGEDINYNFDDMKIKYKNLGVLWNLMNLLIDFSQTNNLNPEEADREKLGLAEKYIISKMNSAIKKQTELMDNYLLNETPWIAEELFLELSRTYIQIIRETMSTGSIEEKQVVMNVIYEVLLNNLKIFAPVCPMITEDIYQQLKQEFGLEKQSIHEYTWPSYEEEEIDTVVEEDMKIAKEIIQAILYSREKAQMGQRWPLQKATVVTLENSTQDSVKKMSELIKNLTNIKEIVVKDEMDEIKSSIKPDIGALGKEFGAKKDTIIERLMATSTQTLIDEIKSKGHKLTIDGEEITIEEKHVKVQRDLPENLEETEFRQGYIYLDKTLTPELETEGFAREITRRVQNMRKDEGLNKNDYIELNIETDERMAKRLKNMREIIKEKTGSLTLNLGTELTHFKNKTKVNIRDREFMLSLTKS
ncbi:MAG: isoleucine--tRNA ligase [Nanoarchaeota archaeon]